MIELGNYKILFPDDISNESMRRVLAPFPWIPYGDAFIAVVYPLGKKSPETATVYLIEHAIETRQFIESCFASKTAELEFRRTPQT